VTHFLRHIRQALEIYLVPLNTHALFFSFFFLNDAPPPEITTLPLHAALPICTPPACSRGPRGSRPSRRGPARRAARSSRSEEHTSELQSHLNLVCRLLLE